MSKIRSLPDLQDRLDKGLSWRVKEVSYVKGSARSATSFAQAALIRAGVPLIYAHWEGFIKEASEAYLTYVSSQNLLYRDLASCFVVFGAKKHVTSIIESRRSAVNIEVVEFFRRSATTQANLALSNAVNTESNLSSTVFENIAMSLGIALNQYIPYANLIDKVLLERRNRIAHGEYLDIDWAAFEDLIDEVLKLLRMYKTDIENLASTQAFRVQAPQVPA
jgi:hypothetical protein